MTNQPIREALIEAMWKTLFSPDENPVVIESFKNRWPEDLISSERRADAALSILSTALAERDARIAELEGLLLDLVRDEKPIDPLDMTNPFCGAPRTKDEILELARAKLKESSNG